MSKGSFPTHWRTFGEGQRKALAIHCNLANSKAWEGVGKFLGETATLHAFDLPGHGESGDWDGEEDLHKLGTDIARTFVTEPMDVIGHSYGATVALRLAVENPRNVRSLTLIEPVFFAPVVSDEPDRVKAYLKDEAPFRERMERGDLDNAARSFNRLWGDGTPWTQVSKKKQAYIKDRLHLVKASLPVLFEDDANLLVPGALDRVAMPCMLVAGEKSVDIIDAINHALARRLPDARRMVIEGAGHMSPMTHPEEVGSAIAALFEVAEE